MSYDCGRIIRTDLNGHPFTPVVLNDDDTGMIINNETRVALIILLGSMSRDEYAKRKLTDKQINMMHQLCHMVQT